MKTHEEYSEAQDECLTRKTNCRLSRDSFKRKLNGIQRNVSEVCGHGGEAYESGGGEGQQGDRLGEKVPSEG